MSIVLGTLLLILFVVLVVVCIVLWYHGLDPARLIRSSYLVPQQHREPASKANDKEEILPLLKPKLSTVVRLNGSPPLYTDIIDQIRACKSASQIDELLASLDLTKLLQSSIKAQHFAHFTRKLCVELLDSWSLARIIVALEAFTSHNEVVECMKRCFVAKHHEDLVQLKHQVDHHISLFRLVFYQIKQLECREAILNHFEEQAHLLRMSSTFKAPIKLLCDIDDTMYSALFDSRYPEMTVYPGALAFCQVITSLYVSKTNNSERRQNQSRQQQQQEQQEQQEQQNHIALDIDGLSMPSAAPPTTRQRLVFLTARPEFLRHRTANDLQACGFKHFELLMGKLTKMMGAQQIASRKLANFKRLRRVFAEHRFIFVGDNGQGDIDLGKTLLVNPELFSVGAVLIHDVIRPSSKTLRRQASAAAASATTGVPRGNATSRAPEASTVTEDQCIQDDSEQSVVAIGKHNDNSDGGVGTLLHQPYRWKECEQCGINTFKTYIGAIFHLYAMGIVEVESVFEVVHACCTTFTNIPFVSEKQKRRCESEILSDLSTVLKHLPCSDAMNLVYSLSDTMLDVSSCMAYHP